MKLIEAIIRGIPIEEVKDSLQKVGVGEMGIEEILVSRLDGDSREKGNPLFYRGTEYMAGFITRMKIEIVVSDDLVDRVVTTIRKIAGTARKEDCRIYIVPLMAALY